MRSKGILFPIVLILLGVLFLLSKMGLLPPMGVMWQRWWPLLLIGAGLVMLVQRL